MLTSKDISALIERMSIAFATKQELKQEKEELQDEIRDLRLDVLEKLDAVFTEVKDMRMEQDMHVQKHRDINDTLEKLQAASL